MGRRRRGQYLVRQARGPVTEVAKPMPDPMREIVDQMQAGAALAGPISVIRKGSVHTFPWGLRGRQVVRSQSVDGLVRRGILHVHAHADGHEAVLAASRAEAPQGRRREGR